MDGIKINTSTTHEVIGKAIKQTLSLAYENLPQSYFVVVQGDSESIKLCRDLLSKDSGDVNEKRFIFIHNNNDSDKAPFLFWDKVLTDLGLGASFDLCRDNIYSVIGRLCSEKQEVDIVKSAIKGLGILDKKLKEHIGAQYHIDQLDNYGNILHGKEKSAMPEIQHCLLFYSYLKEALLDWIRINRWVLQKECFKGEFEFLILDDLMWNEEWPGDIEREKDFLNYLIYTKRLVEKITARKWNFYRLLRPTNGSEEDFYTYVNQVIKDDNEFKFKLITGENNNAFKKNIKDFTHLLIDWKIDDNDKKSGLNIVRDLKEYIQRNAQKIEVVPELLVLTRNPDPTTVQAALESGASGYVIKDNIAALPYVVGRAGKPLTINEKQEIDGLMSDNFPSLRSFPAFVPKALYFDVWRKKENEGFFVEKHKKWLKDIPKADLHVHFGTAIPISVCYDLAIISVYRWACQYYYENAIGNKEKFEQIKNASRLVKEILDNAIKEFKLSDKKDIEDNFKISYLKAFKETTKIYEVATVNNTVKQLKNMFDQLSEEELACLIVTGLGFQYGIYNGESLTVRINEILNICDCIGDLNTKKDGRHPLLSFYLQDSARIIEDVKSCYKKISANDIINVTTSLINLKQASVIINPLSSLLSIPDELQSQAQGLPKYLGAGDLVGASILQFTETLLLASYHIPLWAEKQNVWHQELRAGANGFMRGLKNPILATKIMLLGLYVGVKTAGVKHMTTSVLITAKRHKDKNDIKEAVQLAAEFVTRNENGIENDVNSEEFIPKVLGMDLAGAERGNLPDDLVESFKESFKRCLMMTVHAGEDESVESVWQAVYSLHASRVGHGLRLDDHKNLKRLFKDRQLCVELCPKSNQFTNGYAFEDHEKRNKACYVLRDYLNYGIPITVSTDNPLISHGTKNRDAHYPLCEEYLILPSLICAEPARCEKHGCDYKQDKSSNLINTLLVLKLIYNGFKYSFLDPKEKTRLIEYADRDVFNVLAEDFLKVYISAEG